MAIVGRKRKDGNPLGLERRVYWHHGQFRYRHRDGRWEDLGRDIGTANARAKLYNSPGETFGTIGYWLDFYIGEAAAGRLPAGRKKKPRTIEDNRIEAEYLKASPLAKMWPLDLVQNPSALAEYRDRRVDPETGLGQTRANRELSLMSAMYSWLIEVGKCPGLTVNPVKLVKRFTETPKERYVEDHEFAPVYSIAVRSVCMALDLTYRTLQRPGDLLHLPPSAVRTKTVNGVHKPILSVLQGKTGRRVDIEVTPELEAILYMCSSDGKLESMPMTADGKVRKRLETLVHAADGSGYTDSGLGGMLRRYCRGAGVPSFGLMDVRAKGATDMYLRGVPLEHIQMLMGHASVQTTEIYIKRLLQTVRIAQPNALAVGAK